MSVCWSSDLASGAEAGGRTGTGKEAETTGVGVTVRVTSGTVTANSGTATLRVAVTARAETSVEGAASTTGKVEGVDSGAEGVGTTGAGSGETGNLAEVTATTINAESTSGMVHVCNLFLLPF